MRSLVLLVIGILFYGSSFAQNNVGILRLDSSFSQEGVIGVDFNEVSDEPTSFDLLHYSRITVGGKIHTATPGQIKFGLSRFLREGSADPAFGITGKAILSWGFVDYPNALKVLDTSTGTIIATGASATSETPNVLMPAIFQIKADGTPDSSFGVNGRTATSYDDGSGGEFTTIDTGRSTYTATGYSMPSLAGGAYGFAAMRFKISGGLDSSFGVNGKVMVPAPVHSAKGFLRKDRSLIFIAVDTTSHELLLFQLDGQGNPVLTFGTNGILHTGILTKDGSNIYAALHSATPNFLVALVWLKESAADVPFTLVRFKEDGTPETSFGRQGFASAPSNLSPLHVSGFSLGNDFSPTISGSVDSNRSISAVAKFLISGVIDSNFGVAGIQTLDAGAAIASNSLLSFKALGQDEKGKKKFIGIGTITSSAGNDDFFVARYRQVEKNSVIDPLEVKIYLYPNPATSKLRVESGSDQVQSISIENIFGAPVYKSSEEPNSGIIDVSKFAEGVYFCRIQTAMTIYIKRIIIIH
jgi:uncharacterized delta-60 repeat protein